MLLSGRVAGEQKLASIAHGMQIQWDYLQLGDRAVILMPAQLQRGLVQDCYLEVGVNPAAYRLVAVAAHRLAFEEHGIGGCAQFHQAGADGFDEWRRAAEIKVL